jgi:DNA-binding transcriptional MerR regulator
MAFNFNLIETLERVAKQGTGRPGDTLEKVVTMPGLDKLARAIRELQAEAIGLDGEEHKVLLAFQEIERESEAMQNEIRAKRADVKERLARLQGQMVEAVKACGIMASIPGGIDAKD